MNILSIQQNVKILNWRFLIFFILNAHTWEKQGNKDGNLYKFKKISLRTYKCSFYDT